MDRDDTDRLKEQGDDQFEAVIEAVIAAEQSLPEETEIVKLDPDPQQGEVILRHNVSRNDG